MKRISLILASLLLLVGPKASAHVGGPFDNGDFNSFLDSSGIYQVAFRFSNGSGFAQFGNNVDADLFLTGTGGTTTDLPSSFSTLNRSIIYYKGVSYLGTCTGMVDHERKIVQGVTNGNSDVVTTASNTSGGTTTSASNSLINNGLGFPCNTEFRCKITNSSPVLRFNGKGELTIINPTLGQVGFAAIAALINALGSGGTGGGAATLGPNISAIIAALATPGVAESIPSAESVRDASDHVPMIVFGSRIFFNSRR
jgi:hypothetical protein